jgi:hypothetical protein
MDKDDEIASAGLDNWTAEDQAAIESPEWPEIEKAGARAYEAEEVFGAPDTTIKRLWRTAHEANARLNARVRERLSGIVDGARRKIRAARGARSARRARAGKAKTTSSDDGPPLLAEVGAVRFADDWNPFLAVLAEMIADHLLKEPS